MISYLEENNWYVTDITYNRYITHLSLSAAQGHLWHCVYFMNR